MPLPLSQAVAHRPVALASDALCVILFLPIHDRTNYYCVLTATHVPFFTGIPSHWLLRTTATPKILNSTRLRVAAALSILTGIAVFALIAPSSGLGVFWGVAATLAGMLALWQPNRAAVCLALVRH